MDKQKFPGWRYHPKTGQGQIFNSPEEVPQGWVDRYVPTDGEVHAPVARTVAIAATETEKEDGELSAELQAIAGKLEDDNTHKELVAMLEAMNEDRAEDEQVEFLATWPKRKLAEAIVANGGPVVEPEEPEED